MKKLLENTVKQVRWWTWAAWTTPFVALAAIVLEHYIGHDDWLQKLMLTITIIFFTTSVLWWWWALSKIVKMYKVSHQNEDNFKELLSELKEAKEIIKDLRDSNR